MLLTDIVAVRGHDLVLLDGGLVFSILGRERLERIDGSFGSESTVQRG